jgi:hypothetical protein
MRTGGGAGQRRHWFLGVIFIATLIDGVLLAIVHANFIRDHGYDVSPPHRAVSRLALP